MNTHESYVSLETAKLLKKAGFDWDVTHFYHSPDSSWKNPLFEERNYYEANDYNNDGLERIKGEKHARFISAPTLDVAQRWLREVKNIHLYIEPYYYSHYDKSDKLTDESFAYYYVGTYDFDEEVDISGYEKTYEETIEAGIKKALELILEKEE